MSQPLVSVIIPTRDLSYYIIFENLPALDKQTYKNFEVIILNTAHEQYDLTLLKQYKWLRIIPTGKITRPAEKRDIGVKESKGEIIAFIDDDAYPSSNWLENAVKIFSETNVDAVAGPGVLPKLTNIWEKTFDEVLKTFIGAGGYSYRFVPEKERFVDDYPSMNFLIKKTIFNKLGGFNSDYWPGEDSKLCNDLVYKENGEILYSPDVLIYHHRRNNLKGYLKQHGNYGFHRGAFFAHGDRNSRRIGYLIPTFFVVYLLLFVLLIIGSIVFKVSTTLIMFASLPLVIYIWFLIQLFFSATFNTKNTFIGLQSMLVLFLTHVIYGVQFVKGFIKGRKKSENIYS